MTWALIWAARSISIHALLAESDISAVFPQAVQGNFNPRSPCGERRACALGRKGRTHFNPRSPCGERRVFTPRHLPTRYFNPRSPCGERLPLLGHLRTLNPISIHALLAESDGRASSVAIECRSFQSTLSLRRATSPSRVYRLGGGISIHALLAESDCPAPRKGNTRDLNFNPRSPCGERRYDLQGAIYQAIISIHALLAESDASTGAEFTNQADFNPRSPCGERPFSARIRANSTYFNPRSPCGERRGGQ